MEINFRISEFVNSEKIFFLYGFCLMKFNFFSCRSITQSYYRSAHALILVYDISCQPTFDALTDWIREIQEYANPKVLKILVGNKTDRDDREIPMRVGEEFAKQHEMYFLETSSKQGENGKIEAHHCLTNLKNLKN